MERLELDTPQELLASTCMLPSLKSMEDDKPIKVLYCLQFEKQPIHTNTQPNYNIIA
jgi:hypothetical protein